VGNAGNQTWHIALIFVGDAHHLIKKPVGKGRFF